VGCFFSFFDIQYECLPLRIEEMEENIPVSLEWAICQHLIRLINAHSVLVIVHNRGQLRGTVSQMSVPQPPHSYEQLSKHEHPRCLSILYPKRWCIWQTTFSPVFSIAKHACSDNPFLLGITMSQLLPYIPTHAQRVSC
jgi:hypothetical protein